MFYLVIDSAMVNMEGSYWYFCSQRLFSQNSVWARVVDRSGAEGKRRVREMRELREPGEPGEPKN